METTEERSGRIIAELREKYPNTEPYDLNGGGQHFVCEIEPSKDHPEYDRAIEVIFKSQPHKHVKMTQEYTILSGTLELKVDDAVHTLNTGDTYIVKSGAIHSATSDEGSWIEIYSEPGWTAEDHIRVGGHE